MGYAMSESGGGAQLPGMLAGSPVGAPEAPEETLSQVVRVSGYTAETVRRLADKGLIPCRRDGNGRRVFPSGSGELARRLRSERMAQFSRRSVGP